MRMEEYLADLYEAAVEALDDIDGADPERAHALADEILLDLLPWSVQDAYQRLVERCGWWATA